MQKKKPTAEPAKIAGSVFIAENGKKYFKLKGRVYALDKQYKNEIVTSVQESIRDTPEKIEVYTKREYKRTYTRKKDGKTIKRVVQVKGYRSNLGYEVGEKKYLEYVKTLKKPPKKKIDKKQIMNQSFLNQVSIALAKGAKVMYNGKIVTLDNLKSLKSHFKRLMLKAKVTQENETDPSPIVLFDLESDGETFYNFTHIN